MQENLNILQELSELILQIFTTQTGRKEEEGGDILICQQKSLPNVYGNLNFSMRERHFSNLIEITC